MTLKWGQADEATLIEINCRVDWTVFNEHVLCWVFN